MDTTKEITEIGCYNLSGAIIRQALQDYQYYGKKIKRGLSESLYNKDISISLQRRKKDLKQMEYYFESAEAYLFNKNQLESWLEVTGLSRIVSIGYIRHVAKNVDITGQKKIEWTTLRKRPEDEENYA